MDQVYAKYKWYHINIYVRKYYNINIWGTESIKNKELVYFITYKGNTTLCTAFDLTWCVYLDVKQIKTRGNNKSPLSKGNNGVLMYILYIRYENKS